MKATLTLLGLIAFAPVAEASIYHCDGFSGVDEYRSTVDLEAGMADFFDNDNTSDLKLVRTRSLESLPPQTQYTFEGKDVSYPDSSFRLVFTLPSRKATLVSISNGEETDYGTVTCSKE